MNRSKSINSLAKAITILKSFNSEELELGVKDISKKLNMPTSTVHRLLATLYREGLLDKDRKTVLFAQEIRVTEDSEKFDLLRLLQGLRHLR